MERKSKLNKIVLTCDLISEEKLSIQDNLDNILDQVLKQVANLKTNQEHMKQKEISSIHKYIVDVLKQLCEVNAVLEILIEDIPIQILKTEGENMCKSVEPRKEPLIHSELITSRTSCSSSTHIESTSESLAESMPLIDLVPELLEIQTQSNSDKVESDIQTLKKSLFEFNEKFGLNKQNYSDMKDYYGKASTSSQATLKEEGVLLPDSSFSHELCEGNFELPEKDTNTLQDCKQEVIDELNNTSSSCVSVNYDVKCEYLETSTPLLSVSENTSENSSCIDVEIALLNNKAQDKPQELNNSKYTALEKLNNLRVKETDNSENCTAPDMKLQPSGIIIQNSISATDKSKKKEKKKKQNQAIYDVKLKETPKVGDECLFSHIESPFEFYIHINDATTLMIDEITQKINRICSNQQCMYDTKEEAIKNLGKFCFGLINRYKNWYRVQILDYFENENNDNVLVHLIDYGNKAVTPFRNLRRMTKEFSEIPMLAVQCHLPLLFPIGSTHFNRLTEWSMSTIEAMINICGIDRSYSEDEMQFFKIVYAEREENNSVAIDMYRPDRDEETTLGQILIDTKHAIQIINDYDSQNMELEMYLDDMEYLEADNINEAITGYDAKDEARICRFTKKDGTCYKGKSCKLEHVPHSKDGYTTDKEEVFTEAMYSLILPPVGSKVNVLVTGYIDVCRFFAQIINIPYNYKGQKIMDHDMFTLLQEMNSSKMVKTYESFKVAPAIGEIVIVYHFKKWGRAVVREIITGDNGDAVEVQLFVLDIGEYVRAFVKDIRKIKPEFLKLPFQAVECYIHDYRVKKNCSPKAKNFFYTNICFRNFIATIMSSNLPLKVELSNQNQSMIVGKILESRGFAERRSIDMNVANDCPLDLY